MRAAHMPGVVYSERKLAAAGHAAWYGAGLVLAFAVPFVFTSWLDVPNDAYYAIYFAAMGAFLGAYVVESRLDVAGMFTRNWRWSLFLGLGAAAFTLFAVLGREDSTPRPDGLYFAFTVAWRGLLYGIVDALVLSAFPMAVAYAMVGGGRLHGWGRKLEFGALAMVLTLAITAVYHLGYEQFREDGVAAPEIGNAVISVPSIATLNPLGSLLAHATMHVTADIHAYETEVFLPPKTTAD